MEIRKIERKESQWDSTKNYAIETSLYKTETKECCSDKEPTYENITISTREDFLKVVSQISIDNDRNYTISLGIRSPYYKVKRLIILNPLLTK